MQNNEEKIKRDGQELYDGNYNDELKREMLKSKELCFKYNHIKKKKIEERTEIIKKLFANVGKDVRIEPNFFCDYGYNIELGNNVDINYNCVILDDNLVTIGNDVRIAPNVNIFTVYHPLDPVDRKNSVILSKPVVIEDNAWIGGGAIILPGVTIGKNAVVGAGSVVTHDVPPNKVVAGNPARIIKEVKNE